MNTPKNVEFSVKLYGGGEICFGYETLNGQICGSQAILARINIPLESGGSEYPIGWFPTSFKSMHQVKKVFPPELGESFLTESILVDCYRFHWKILNSKK